MNLLGPGTAVIHCELDKKEIRTVRQDILTETKNTEVRSRPANRGVDLGPFQIGVFPLKKFERFHPPSRGRRDAASEVADANFLPRTRLDLFQHIRDTTPPAELDRLAPRVIVLRGESRDKRDEKSDQEE